MRSLSSADHQGRALDGGTRQWGGAAQVASAPRAQGPVQVDGRTDRAGTTKVPQLALRAQLADTRRVSRQQPHRSLARSPAQRRIEGLGKPARLRAQARPSNRFLARGESKGRSPAGDVPGPGPTAQRPPNSRPRLSAAGQSRPAPGWSPPVLPSLPPELAPLTRVKFLSEKVVLPFKAELLTWS